MAKAFTLVSWNVEHFKGKPVRVARVVDFLKNQKPDVFALYEVEGKAIYDTLTLKMPGYQFHITEGPQVQEILVGVKKGLTAFFTQKVTFRAGNRYLRPGALLTLRIDGKNYPILFLHTKSGTKPVGLGIRDDMFQRAFKFKKLLDRQAGGKGKANFMFLGDLNTMGMKYPFKKNIAADIEIRKLNREAKKRNMRLLSKNGLTWWNGPGTKYPQSDLDQVVASNQLKFKKFSGADVDVRGWPKLTPESKQGKWIRDYSDHGLLYFQVEKI
jgi:hypothetical protein